MHRIFIDEIGNSDLGSSDDENQRYLSLTGIIADLTYHDDVITCEMAAIKKGFFGDESIGLHRKDILNRCRGFECLNEATTRAAFDETILAALTRWQYRVVTVVIDKREHKERYGVWQFHPYHYCLMVLMERYCMHLEGGSWQGDVMVESRQRQDNEKLDNSYRGFYDKGTDYISATRFQTSLTSRQLKIKDKKANIAGLQIADLLANPSWRGLLCARLKQPMTAHFGSQVVKMLHGAKYLQSPAGFTKGYGLKWLPK